MAWRNWNPQHLVAAASVASALTAIAALLLNLHRSAQLAAPLEPNSDYRAAVSSSSSFKEIPQVPSGLFNYGGSTSWAPIRGLVDPEIQKVRPEFQLRYVHPLKSEPGSGAGISMLLDSELAFAQTSRPLTDRAIQDANSRGIILKQIPVAVNGIAVAVHPDLPIAGISIQQIKAIFTGEYTNWKQLGGPDLPIQLFDRITASREMIKNFLIEQEMIKAKIQSVSDPTEAIQKVAKTPGGITFGSAALLVKQCSVKTLPVAADEFVAPYQEPMVAPADCSKQNHNQINTQALKNGTYPLTDSLFVVVNQNGSVQQQAGEAYAEFLLTEQGQRLIEKAGFVRIR
jgi:phosphate transport system substrate-binding protein